jgi:capsular exopolysaccharide synthesis family protein
MRFTRNKESKVSSDRSLKRKGSPQLSAVSKPKPPTLSEGCILIAGGELTDFVAAERFRMLRSQIERLRVADKHLNVFALTSAVPSEGKSVTSVNLARSFSSDPNGKTIIVDCDLRKPNLHRFYKGKSAPGLSDLLMAGASIDSVLHHVEEGLDAIYAGSPVIDSSRTIESEGFGLLLAELRESYRYVFLDCPPVLMCSEVLSIARAVSGTLLVTRAWRTEQALVAEAAEMLRSHNLLGVVFNECTDSLKQYGYYGYYGYVGMAKGGDEESKKKSVFKRLFG